MKITENGNEIVVEGEAQCHSCDGTGLYQGMAEHNGAAVVCTNCKGKGVINVKLAYQKFTERKIRKGVKRVYTTAAGYTITDEDITTKEGNTIRFSQAGCTYEEWLNGITPKSIKDLHCPYQHTHQGLQDSTHPCHGLYKTRCKDNLGFGFLSDCKKRSQMNKCWEIYDQLEKTS